MPFPALETTLEAEFDVGDTNTCQTPELLILVLFLTVGLVSSQNQVKLFQNLVTFQSDEVSGTIPSVGDHTWGRIQCWRPHLGQNPVLETTLKTEFDVGDTNTCHRFQRYVGPLPVLGLGCSFFTEPSRFCEPTEGFSWVGLGWVTSKCLQRSNLTSNSTWRRPRERRSPKTA